MTLDDFAGSDVPTSESRIFVRSHGSVLVLWSQRGALDEWYTDEGGPLGLWRPWANDLLGQAVEGGHFFPEEHPRETAEALQRFFS